MRDLSVTYYGSASKSINIKHTMEFILPVAIILFNLIV